MNSSDSIIATDIETVNMCRMNSDIYTWYVYLLIYILAGLYLVIYTAKCLFPFPGFKFLSAKVTLDRCIPKDPNKMSLSLHIYIVFSDVASFCCW